MRGSTYTTGMVAQALSARIIGRDDLAITDLAGLDQAGPGSLSFIRSPHYAGKWAASKAAAALVSKAIEVPGHDPAARALIIVDDADRALNALLGVIAKENAPHRPPPGVHPTALVDPTATVAPTAAIGPACIIGPRCRIDESAVLHPRVTLGAGVHIGGGGVLHPGVVVYDRCSIGPRSILHAGVVIGADGFGYLPDPSGQGLTKVPHIGTVEIGADVEIGANSCIDRAKFGVTAIGDGTKIDNLVQIGHNCRIGRSVIICGSSAIGGSVTIGDGAVVAGAVGIADNVEVGARATIAARSGVFCDVPPGESCIGYPAMLGKEAARNMACLRSLAETTRTVRRLARAAGEKRLHTD